MDRLSATFDCLLIDAGCIINTEGNIPNTITVLLKVVSYLHVTGVQCGNEGVNDFSIPNHVCASISLTSLKALVSNVFKSHTGGVIASSLLGISDPEFNVIEGVKDSNSRLNKVKSNGLLFRWVFRSLPCL